MSGASHRHVIAWLLVIVLATGCGSSSSSSSPRASHPSSSPPVAAEVPGPTATATPGPLPSPTAAPADPFVGQLAVTVSADVRVRSQPWVGEDSIKYGPLLPIYTELRVLDGPVEGSGYVWYQVEPLDFTLDGGPGHGWVAMAGKDEEPWIGPKPAGGPAPSKPTRAAFAEDGAVRVSDDREIVTITQTARWRAPRDPGLMIRVYGVTECMAYPASPVPDTDGPCLLEDTPLPASVLRLLATAPASDGTVSWKWTEETGCDIAAFASRPGGRSYYSVVLAAYGASGRSHFAIAEPGHWWVSGPGDMPC